MGKHMSKTATGGLRTRRRSQVISQPAVVSSPEPPRLVPETTSEIFHTLKLQSDELAIYKGRLTVLLRKEEETIKGLMKDGKTDRARLLLKKKRFQEHILQETENQLNSILNHANGQAAILEMKKEVDATIDRNSEAMKKLHILLALENAEWMLKETFEGHKKASEVDQLLHLASLGEKELLEKDAEAEMQKLVAALGLATTEPEVSKMEKKEDAEILKLSANDTIKEEEEENELEALVNKKLKEKEIVAPSLTDAVDNVRNEDESELEQAEQVLILKLKPDTNEEVEVTAEEAKKESPISDVISDSSRPGVVSQDNEGDNIVVSSISEVNAVGDGKGEEEIKKAVIPESEQSEEERAEISNLLPDVPTHSIDMNNATDVVAKPVTQQPIAIAEDEIV